MTQWTETKVVNAVVDDAKSDVVNAARDVMRWHKNPARGDGMVNAVTALESSLANLDEVTRQAPVRALVESVTNLAIAWKSQRTHDVEKAIDKLVELARQAEPTK